MRRHFRSLVDANDGRGNSFTFRFYDPRVLRRYLPTCTHEELSEFFGKVHSFFAEAESGQQITEYKLEKGELKQTELS
jgi:hypothetical protein